MKPINEMKIILESRSCNEAFARSAVASFLSIRDPNIEEISDVKTAVSEAVTNCIVHGYKEAIGKIYIQVRIFENARVSVTVRDKGCGIPDVQKAMEPLFTTAGGERSGLGFTVMESFSDSLKVRSSPGKGTVVTITKKISGKCD